MRSPDLVFYGETFNSRLDSCARGRWLMRSPDLVLYGETFNSRKIAAPVGGG